MNRAGKVTLPSARVSITDPLSMGWRIPCKTELLNSASSSKKALRGGPGTPRPAAGAAASHEPGQRGAVMRMAEGALARDDGIDGLGGHGMDHGRLQHLVGTERRHDGGHPGGEHGLARPGRSHHEQPVTAGRAAIWKAPLGRLVACDLREVERLDGREAARPCGRQHHCRASLTGRLNQRRHGEQPHVV